MSESRRTDNGASTRHLPASYCPTTVINYQRVAVYSSCRKMYFVLSVFFLYLCSACGHVSGDEYIRHYQVHITAIVNITYRDPVTGEMTSERKELGRYGFKSRQDTEWGTVVHVRTANNETHGCSPPVNVPNERWIALVERGSCKFTDKIYNAAVLKNASAVVIYNHKDEDELLTMDHNVDDVVSIFIFKKDGERIASLVDNNTKVMMYISVGKQVGYGSYSTQINKTSVLFVSISFIVLMIISLAWLVFYYIQRFRYAHAKERLSKRLMHAAKKAISKMPVRTLKSGDREIDYDFDQCAVCIESYKVSDVIRILPCKHTFHKGCVDPWLMEQRSCPMCKLDILKAYGLQIHGSRDSMINIEVEAPSTSLGPFDILSADNGREFDCNGVEVIRFQTTPISRRHRSDDDDDDDDDDDNDIDGDVDIELEQVSGNAQVHCSMLDKEDGALGVASRPDVEELGESSRVEEDPHEVQREEVDNKAAESVHLLNIPSTSMDSLTSDSTERELLVPKLSSQPCDQSHDQCSDRS